MDEKKDTQSLYEYRLLRNQREERDGIHVTDRGILLTESLLLRPLEMSDIDKGYFETLGNLTSAPVPPKESFQEQFLRMKEMKETYYNTVVEDLSKGKIAACATLFIEQKFIRNIGKAGHIEDVVVHQDYRKNRLGTILMHRLMELGARLGCYKIILDCAEEKQIFYEKCGFKKRGCQMAWYADSTS
eukprot:TRINITY_DN10295_c0_g1_i1.p1 TRINITY_DN10295_c0_g1~~TRINITY_DN10295_c0_g1_i1.p1  ORF type:complete len:187 (-),score=38.55 TRINITY_DN10295_c0_g1_i1:35-595(-)